MYSSLNTNYRHGLQTLATVTILILAGRNANASVAIALIVSRMHDGPACAGRGQIRITT